MTHHPCTTCRHFRPARPLSQLLARELGIEDQALATELIKMMQDEGQRRDQEAERRVEQLGHRKEAWSFKPSMSDYCGLREEEEVYLFHESRNKSGCDDHQPAPAAAADCATCSHRVAPTANERDRRILDDMRKLSSTAAALGQGGGDQGMANYIQLIGSKKAFEAAQAFYAGKITHLQPDYLLVCGKHSTASDFVPCVVQNPHNACKDHSGASDPGSPPPRRSKRTGIL